MALHGKQIADGSGVVSPCARIVSCIPHVTDVAASSEAPRTWDDVVRCTRVFGEALTHGLHLRLHRITAHWAARRHSVLKRLGAVSDPRDCRGFCAAVQIPRQDLVSDSGTFSDKGKAQDDVQLMKSRGQMMNCLRGRNIDHFKTDPTTDGCRSLEDKSKNFKMRGHAFEDKSTNAP